MIIGIGGVSRAGKTTLSARLKKRIKGKTIKILNQDDFVKKNNLPMIKNHVDWEHPDSIDWKSLEKAIRTYRSEFEIVIVEGIFAFYHTKIAKTYDQVFFVHIPKDLFFNRKNKDLHWGKEPQWFIKHIWKSYLLYGRLPEFLKQVIWIDGSRKTPLEPLIQLMEA
ncbi:MAG: hypothetical protein SH818_12165 [Saprospiraceae bacterium]|nr:hypothetical protein [Saprospiraceae bacterium]